MEASEILSKAAEILERDGWHQGSYYKIPDKQWTPTSEMVEAAETAPVCSMGALYRAVSGSASLHPTVKLAQDEWRANAKGLGEATKRLAKQIGTDCIIDWNDEVGRSKEDVILAFKKAANSEDS